MLQQILGFAGVILTLLAYFAVQTGMISSQQIRFSVLNFTGAALVLISLLGSEHYAAIFLELAWVVISALGIWRAAINSSHNVQAKSTDNSVTSTKM